MMQEKLDELQRRIYKVTKLIENLCMSTCDHYFIETEDCRECTNYGYVQILNILTRGDQTND